MDRTLKRWSRGRYRRETLIRKTVLYGSVLVGIAGLVAADRLGLFGFAPIPDVQKYHEKFFLVVNVVDGDTLDVDVPDGRYRRTRIRLWGVDTPETVRPDTPPQHFGKEASAFTRSQTLNKRVRLVLEPYRKTRDRHGRLLAFVYLPDGRMLNRLLIEEGYAYADPRYEHHLQAEFRRLQRRARQAGKGLWKGLSKDDLPYYYRQRLKLPSNQNVPHALPRK